MFVHWILVGVAIGIGLMIAPLVVRLGLWAICILVENNVKKTKGFDIVPIKHLADTARRCRERDRAAPGASLLKILPSNS
jgi:hypothetical protein